MPDKICFLACRDESVVGRGGCGGEKRRMFDRGRCVVLSREGMHEGFRSLSTTTSIRGIFLSLSESFRISGSARVHRH